MIMNSRIKLFLDYKQLTHVEFASSIGVQPSNITHVIRGRNKPGFQFIANMLNTYPEINARWLITGIGDMLEKGFKEKKSEPDLFSSLTDSDFLKEGTSPDKILHSDEVNSDKKTTSIIDNEEAKLPLGKIENNSFDNKPPYNESHAKKIQSIVIFHTDNSFTYYDPS